MPYYSFCMLCRCSFDREVAVCNHCDTDEYLIDIPFEEKNRDR